MTTSISITEVDGGAQRDILLAMEEELLPGCEPINPAVGHWWLAKDQHGVHAAYAALRLVASEPGVGFLFRCGVVKDFRGHGLQQRLIRVRLAKAKRLGLTRVITYTIDNPPSANSLIACGFRMYTPANRWGGAEAQYWYRKL